ncbi:hypothetical protein [Dyella mobilis]|uniref:4-vinyl reductase 4VR domain-containing protein n=1 Tax=Dyella mobilis TaxID=1849582 RepID=A0ABS2KI70_9GAMM|nr:hypothetical protein [Dyella mobilis]MBM7130618.1 hypothetical protein [Dyella mobilis]GLQ97245.1 hypothetical protein GCM10007863_16650 [Dyella mobilis]
MIELEVQALSVTREGLLIDVGRVVVASGFTLLRQRLVQDPNGVLVTLVVRGPERKQRVLEAALDAHERLISFQVLPFEEGVARSHFAAERTFAREAPPAPPAPEPVVEAVVLPSPAKAEPTQAVVVPQEAPQASKPMVAPEPDPDFTFLLEPKPSPAPSPMPIPVEPYVEPMSLGPDLETIEKLMPRLQSDYPGIFPALHALEKSVAAAALESSLHAMGQRTGTWLFMQHYRANGKLGLNEAIRRIGVPALGSMLEVEYKGEGLHIRNSPLCRPDHPSGCKFFIGYLEGLLGPVLPPDSLSIFEVCCRSYGADDCVLAISD